MPGYSFEKFNYGLRPSKQVERKILIEKLLRLSQIGFDLRNYTYVGFGSVYYIDFIMFHKFHYLRDMLCVEWSDRPKRMKFNKPYKSVKLKMKPFADVVDSLSKKRPYLIWLDYDYPVNASMLQDIDSCIHRLAPGSIFLVTAEARARLTEEDPANVELLSVAKQEDFLVTKYKEAFGTLVDHDITSADLDKNAIINLFWQAINGRINDTLAMRDDITYSQVFNFYYADGAPMITVGGVIGKTADHQKLADASFYNEMLVTAGADPVKISVPHLTMKEKSWLDGKIDAKLTVAQLAFELEADFLDNYRRFYKEYPTFIEALM